MRWQMVVIVASLAVMAAALIFVFLVSNGAFSPVGG